uniref:Protein JASON-like n=1 Tax=Ananas comosus var. bracteatus TaxID=296719 RepID=A0A6V7NMQ6_ANACO|nr:unnamed protein product [Ananas comosus var. bracteatus]
MGCLFGCFRIKDDDRGDHFISSSIASANKINGEKLVSKNQLAAIFLREDKGSPCEKSLYQNSQERRDKERSDRELKDEAKFLKSFGTLLETPEEIRKASESGNAETLDQGGVPPVRSWLPGITGKALFTEGQQVAEVSENGSSISKGHQTSVQHQSTVKHDSGLKCRIGSVTSNTSPQESKESHLPSFVSRCEPFPTPLKLTEEMQTPATAYPADQESLKTRKNTRICTQYMYPVLNPVHNLSQASEHTDSELCGNHAFRESQRNAVTPWANRAKGPLNQDDPELAVPSLSQWLKPPVANSGGRYEISPKSRSQSGMSSDVDRPIIGMVAAHWNEEESDPVPPKWWDGNGIPNSTNKYKEDQKVSWHATPFEERLEKALSEEKLQSQRKHSNGKSIEFRDEGEESDTAAS